MVDSACRLVEFRGNRQGAISIAIAIFIAIAAAMYMAAAVHGGGGTRPQAPDLAAFWPWAPVFGPYSLRLSICTLRDQ